MTAFWPGPGWQPWDDLVAAGFRCTSDRRNVAPPVVLFEIERQEVTGTAGDGCLVIEGAVKVSVIPPGPDSADAMKWAWTGPVDVLMHSAYTESAALGSFEELTAVEVTIPFSHKEA